MKDPFPYNTFAFLKKKNKKKQLGKHPNQTIIVFFKSLNSYQTSSTALCHESMTNAEVRSARMPH